MHGQWSPQYNDIVHTCIFDCFVPDVVCRCPLDNNFPEIDDAVNLTTTMSLLSEFGFSELEVHSVIKLVAGLIHLGDIRVHERTGLTVSELLRTENPLLTAKLIEVPPQDLILMLFGKEHRAVVNPEEPIGVDGGQTAGQRSDQLATALYYRLFMFIVQRINHRLSEASGDSGIATSEGRTLRVVDGLGWTCATRNGMAQLVRNYTAEKFTKHFCEYEYLRLGFFSFF